MLQGLPFPIKKEIVINGNRILLLDVPLKIIYNRNVFGVDKSGEIIWQIEEINSYPGNASECPFIDIAEGHGKLVLFNWCDLRLIVDPANGRIIKKEEIR